VDSVVVWSVAITAMLGLLGLLVRFVAKISKAVAIFMEDWGGEEPRPGVPARPGVMQRVGSAETRLDGVEHRLGGVERQVGRLLLDADDGGGEAGSGERARGLLGRLPGG
jgi:hypothetical protein